MTPFREAFTPRLRDLLIGRARHGQKITYGQVAKVLGIPHHRPIRFLLGAVGKDCQEKGEPILTAMVVNASTRECGEGLLREFGVQDPVAERHRCQEYWELHENEQTDNIDRRAIQFAVIEVRPDQAAFRREVFERYDGKCPLTNCEIAKLLDAAHLPSIKWRDGHNRGEDGILLRADIHRLMDAGLLQLLDDGSVNISETALKEYPNCVKASWWPPTLQKSLSEK